MISPELIFKKYLNDDSLNLDKLIEHQEMDFPLFCKFAFEDKRKNFAFYSVKSTELRLNHPKVIVKDVSSIKFQEGELGKIFPQLIDWFKVPKFKAVTKSSINISLSTNNTITLELIWFSNQNSSNFLITKNLQ